MKCIKTIWFDIKNGICRNIFLWASACILAGAVFLDAFSRMNAIGKIEELNLTEVSFGDILVYAYGGMARYIPSPDRGFEFPIIWITIFITITFITMNYPTKNLMGIGSQILVRTGGRFLWWRSKLIWNVLITSTYHVLFLLGLTVLSGINGIPLNLQIHTELIRHMFEIDMSVPIIDRKWITIAMIILPILISIVLNLFEMVLSLFIKPIFSFLLVSVILISSAYLYVPWMIGNYAMILRYSWMVEDGFRYYEGFVIAAMIAVVLLLIGHIRFKHYDILSRGEN